MWNCYYGNPTKANRKISRLWEFWHMISPDNINVTALLGYYYLTHGTSISNLITSLEKVISDEGKKCDFCILFSINSYALPSQMINFVRRGIFVMICNILNDT